MIGALTRELRPAQWTKNVLVAAAPLAAGTASATAIRATVIAFVAFCLLSSAVYWVNDIVDADRRHPAEGLRAAGVPVVDVLYLDVTDTASHARFTETAFAAGDLDVVVMAAGVLPDQATALADPAVAVASAEVNYLGPMSVLLHASARLRAQGHGVLVVLSSVAAERPRWDNFVYGSAKAGLDAFATGLGDQLIGSGVRVLVVRPGFVPTRMTAGRPSAPLSSSSDDVGAAVAAALSGPTTTVWVPGRLRWAMSALRHLPRPVFRRLPR